MKIISIWERTNYSHPFRDPENVMYGLFTEEEAAKFLEDKNVITDTYGGHQGWFTREERVRGL